MAASRYRRFLRLCEEWPVEETKQQRDLGSFLRQKVAQAFREGENTPIPDPEACDQMYESLVRIHTNFYKNKYPRLKETTFTGVTVEDCRTILATGTAAGLGLRGQGKGTFWFLECSPASLLSPWNWRVPRGCLQLCRCSMRSKFRNNSVFWGEESVGFCSIRNHRGFAKALWGQTAGSVWKEHIWYVSPALSSASLSPSPSSLHFPSVSDPGKEQVPHAEMLSPHPFRRAELGARAALFCSSS
uniref:Mitochondrial nucleoid factor 1 n=1 Tax=Serinus canaria TaxID=9135 RepID=A0A8C9NTT6_SERCA